MNIKANNYIASFDEIRRYLSGFEAEGSEKWREERERYVNDHAYRFYVTMNALPHSNRGKSLLELGASPYFMTLLLAHYTEYNIFLANEVRVGRPKQSSIKFTKKSSGEEHTFSYQTFNNEIDRFPYPDNSFNLILCCDLLEHLILDPTHMLLEMHRILVPGGKILITTPNVLVLYNMVTLLKNKRNIYHPYSGYGVYGRHNREWTLEELVQLVSGCGYSIEKSQIVDIYPHRGYSKWLKKLFPFLRDMLLIIGRAENTPHDYYPDNLYRNLPKQYSKENPIPSNLQNQ